MPKYLWTASYNAEGSKGLLKEGGSGRREAVDKLIASGGGTLEGMYFAFGEDDVYIIADFQDNVAAAAVALKVAAAGAVTLKTTVLLTPEEIDDAAKIQVDYRPPGK
jgi:uncharacterized protein with GYD domain